MATTDHVLDLGAAKKYLNMSATRPDDDEELGEFIATAVELVELVRRESIVPVECTERHDPRGWAGYVLVDRVPIKSLTSVTGSDGTSWALDDLIVDRELGRVEQPGWAWSQPLTVAYTAGRNADDVPALYRQAAKVILAHLWQTQRRPLGAGGTRFGSSAAADSDNLTVAGWSLPRAAVELLGPPVPGVA